MERFPSIPKRTSSRRSFAELKAQQPALSQKRSEVSLSIENSRKKLRLSMSFDSEFWVQAMTCAKLEIERVDVLLEMKEYEYLKSERSNRDVWKFSKIYEELVTQRALLEGKMVSYQAQVERLQEISAKSAKSSRFGTLAELAVQRPYVSCFLSSHLGAGADVAAGHRELTTHRSFRDIVYKQYHKVEGEDSVGLAWDVISGEKVSKSSLVAVQFFAYPHGQDALIAIFGDDAKDDLWSADNGLLLPGGIAENLESGIFTIYPDFPDDASLEQRIEWYNTDPKEWRIQFLDRPPAPTDPKAEVPLYHQYYTGDIRWKDLDGKRLLFQGEARPKARFMYFQFLLNMLRFAWRNKQNAAAILPPELGMPYWGTPGRYVQPGQLRGFMIQLGHVIHDPGQAGEVKESSGSRGDTREGLIEALNSQIIIGTQRQTLSPEELEDSDYDSNDEEDPFIG